jgi:hypothetical protein
MLTLRFLLVLNQLLHAWLDIRHCCLFDSFYISCQLVNGGEFGRFEAYPRCYSKKATTTRGRAEGVGSKDRGIGSKDISCRNQPKGSQEISNATKEIRSDISKQYKG